MREEISVLLLHQQNDSLAPLILALEDQALTVRSLRNFQEAGPLLLGANPPHLVVTEARLPDGTWSDVVTLTLKAAKAVNVIVTARLLDDRVYLDAMEGGAFDFIVPPVSRDQLAHVVRCAVENTLSRREERSEAGKTPGPATDCGG